MPVRPSSTNRLNGFSVNQKKKCTCCLKNY
jgi:hypothetical protein